MPLDRMDAIVFLAIDLGCQQVQVPTDFILKNPFKWLELIERRQATRAPNFAFSLMNERAKKIYLRTWDLLSMRFWVNAGEQMLVMNTYLLNNVHPNRDNLDINDNLNVVTVDFLDGFQMMMANDKDFLPTRTSYKLMTHGVKT